MEPSELPCTFSAFVAERRGISVDEADELLVRWLTTYEPRVRRSLPQETEGDRESANLRVCA